MTPETAELVGLLRTIARAAEDKDPAVVEVMQRAADMVDALARAVDAAGRPEVARAAARYGALRRMYFDSVLRADLRARVDAMRAASVQYLEPAQALDAVLDDLRRRGKV